MKKTIWIWIMIVLFAVSIFSEILALIGVSYGGASLYYGGHNILNFIAIVMLTIDIIISITFVYNLFKLKKSIFWTDVVFGYAILRTIFAIFADVISNKGTTISNFVELVVIIIVWILFKKHLKKVLSNAR